MCIRDRYIFYYQDKAVDITKMFDKEKECYLVINNGEKDIYFVISYKDKIDEDSTICLLYTSRYKVDQTPSKGQFILTGSATPNHKGILHSGAGRIARIKMRTMSLYESGDSSGDVSLMDLCNGKMTPKMTGEVDLRKIIEYIVRGGWPASLGLPVESAALLPKEYLEAVLNDDIYRVDGVKRNTHKMRLLLRSLARNESTTVSNKTLKNDIKAIDDEDIDTATIADYLNILDRLFIRCV